MLDIGTSGYTNSRIRCNAIVGGYSGYAELMAASSYDMFLNLSATRTDGGWMHFKINNDDYMQLSSSDNKVNIYKDTPISGNLESQRLAINKPSNDNDIPLQIINNNQSWTVASLESTIAGDGCPMQWATPASSSQWLQGVWGSNTNEFVIKSGSNGLTLKPNGSAVLSGNLDVGVTQAQTSIKAYVNHAGYQGNIQIEPRWRSQGFIHFNTNYPEGLLLFAAKDGLHMYVGIEVVHFYKPTTNASDDRLKENEELIENACETLSKLRPQLYDKKPDMENDDPTTWYKESGLIAQEIYYDAPELRHLVHRGKPDLDEEGNSIPLPDTYINRSTTRP